MVRVYSEIDIGQYRFMFTLEGNKILNIDVSKTRYYMGEETDYYDIVTTDKSRYVDPDGIKLRGRIFNNAIVIPHNMSTDEEIMDVDNHDAIAYPTGLTLYCDKYEFDEDGVTYLSMLLYDYATINGYTNAYTKYIIDKGYPRKELNWNL